MPAMARTGVPSRISRCAKETWSASSFPGRPNAHARYMAATRPDPSIVTNPSYFGLDFSGVYGYTTNTSGVLENFALNNPDGADHQRHRADATGGRTPRQPALRRIRWAGTSDIFVPEPGLNQDRGADQSVAALRWCSR